MKTEDKLDTVLSYLNNDKTAPETEQQILDGLKDFKPTFKELYIILHKLCKDGYVDYLLAKKGGVPDPETKIYFITFHGKLFLSRGGYKSETRSQTHKKIWTVAKIIAATLNAIIIVAIAAFTAWLSWRTLSQEDNNNKQIKSIEQRLDTLEKPK